MVSSVLKQHSHFRVLWGIIIGGIIASLFFLFFSKKANQGQTVQDAEISNKDATARIENMEYTEVDDGKVKWILRARVATYFKANDLTELENVHLLLYLDDGSILEMSGDRGIIYAGVKDIEIIGGVTFLFPNGYKAHTERIYYSHSKRQIFSETPVELQGPGFAGKVSEWQYDLKTRKALGRNGVDITWEP